jgi:hypothetical protein
MFPSGSFDDIAHAIQLAVAPVFLLTALGTLINVLTARLGRAVDRSRVLGRFFHQLDDHHVGEEDPQRSVARDELARLEHRIRLTYIAIMLAVISALFICLSVAVAFIDAFISINLARIVGSLFILAVAALVGCLVVFLREIFLAVNTARSAIH